jgi:hypothetical protein
VRAKNVDEMDINEEGKRKRSNVYHDLTLEREIGNPQEKKYIIE